MRKRPVYDNTRGRRHKNKVYTLREGDNARSPGVHTQVQGGNTKHTRGKTMSEVASTRMQKRKAKKSVGREIAEWVVCVAAALALAWAVHTFLGQIVIVNGSSMHPTLENNEKVLVSKISYIAGHAEHGDVAVVKYPGSVDFYIKRIVALSGDAVYIADSKLYINGLPQYEPYIAEPINYNMEEVIVPEGMVFVMGDNRNRSSDSHLDSIGCIPDDQIIGKAVCVIWPINKWKTLLPGALNMIITVLG